jgi:hypothetical protein
LLLKNLDMVLVRSFGGPLLIIVLVCCSGRPIPCWPAMFCWPGGCIGPEAFVAVRF